MKKVFVEGENKLVEDMFIRHGWRIATQVEQADLVCFTGGEDISPILYGESNIHSSPNAKRDLEDIRIFWDSQELNLPCVGICRGGQFLNVMNGNPMIQDIHNHEYNVHKVTIESRKKEFDGLSVKVNSYHHQGMVVNPGSPVDLIGYADDGNIEVVVYTGRGDPVDICFQPHPEFKNSEETEELFFKLINTYV